MKATHDGKTFTLTGEYWAGSYPLDELAKWLAFYRRMRDRFPQANGAYDAPVEALERLAKEIGA